MVCGRLLFQSLLFKMEAVCNQKKSGKRGGKNFLKSSAFVTHYVYFKAIIIVLRQRMNSSLHINALCVCLVITSNRVREEL